MKTRNKQKTFCFFDFFLKLNNGCLTFLQTVKDVMLGSYFTIYLDDVVSLWKLNLEFLLITESALALTGLPELKLIKVYSM